MTKQKKDELYLLVDFLEEEKEFARKDSLYDRSDDMTKYDKIIEVVKSLIKE